MGLFDHFPYTNFHELNLTWILEALKEIQTTMDQFVAINALKFADPIQWSIVRQYEKNTIVIDPLTGTAYISVQPVPSGVIITNTDYWSVVFDLGSFVARAAQNFSDRYEPESTLIATFASDTNDWIVWGDILYRVTAPIAIGDYYVVDTNLSHFTIEEIVGHLEDLTTTDKTSLVNAINEIAAEVLGKIGDLNDLETYNQTKIVNAINELRQFIIRVLGLPNLERATTFDSSYTAGTLILWWETIYRVSVNVNAGDPIEIGTNVSGDNIGGIVTAIYTYLTNLSNSINDLSDTIGNLTSLTTTDKSSIVNAINEVDHDVDILKRRKFIFIGDSWNTTATPPGGVPIVPWNNFVRLFMGIQAGDYYNIGYNGSGFSGGRKYLELLQEDIDPIVTNKDEITDIIVLGGVNDIYHLGDLWNDLNDFKAHVAATYPNALLTIGMCEWNTNPNINKLLKQVYGYYLTAVGKNSRCIPNCYSAAHIYEFYQPDGGHLTADGSNHLGQFIANFLNGGGMSGWDAARTANVTVDSTVVDTTSLTLTTSQMDINILSCLHVNNINFVGGASIAPLVEYKIGSVDPKHLCGIADQNTTSWETCVWGFDGNYHPLQVMLYLKGFDLYFKILTVDPSTGVAPRNYSKLAGDYVSKVFNIYDC